jgi:hypothetical protein
MYTREWIYVIAGNGHLADNSLPGVDELLDEPIVLILSIFFFFL